MTERWPLDRGAPDVVPAPAHGQTVLVTAWDLAAWIDRDPTLVRRLTTDQVQLLARAYLAERAQRRRAE